MTKLLFALPRFHTNLWFAARAMSQNGYDVTFLVNQSAPLEDHSFVTPVEMGQKPSARDVHAAVAKAQPDVIFVRNSWALSPRTAKAARRLGIPALVYNLDPVDKPASLASKAKRYWKGLPKARITPVPGLATNDAAADSHFLPWPVACLPTTKTHNRAGGLVRLLCVGKLSMPRKNHLRLIEAIERAGLQDHVMLTLVGSGARPGTKGAAYFEALKKRAQVSWIEIRTNVKFADMPDLYANADVCILPSSDEPLGVAPAEAMAYGTIPIISHDAGSARYLTHGRDGFVIDPEDTGPLEAHLTELVTSPSRRATMSAATRETAKSELSEARFLERLAAIIDTVRR